MQVHVSATSVAFSFSTCISSLPDNGQRDWPIYVAGGNKSEYAMVKVLCFGWIGTADGWFKQRNDVDEIRKSDFFV